MTNKGSVSIRVVDAFTPVPFTGNPAGVCVLDKAADEQWMQHVAREMNHAETAFLYPTEDGYSLRWFTPTVEVKLCGHATVASAHVLWEDGHLEAGKQARFHTLSGLLTADQENGWVKLDFPSKPPEECAAPNGLLESLGLAPAQVIYIGKNVFDYLVEVADDAIVRSVNPDMGMLAGVEARGAIVTARSSQREYDFISRFFAPAAGVPEDPVTGSAHCCLTPYWSAKLGKEEMTAYQASPRGGVVKVAQRGDRVWLFGQAVTVLRGELNSVL